MEKLESRYWRWLVLAVLAAVTTYAPNRLLAVTPAEQALLSKAQSLAAHGQLNMAVQTWQQLLLSDPQNKEALAGIAQAEMRLGNPDQAKKYLDRLRALGADARTIAGIESMSHLQSPAARLQRAKRLVRDGKYAEALQIYRDLYGSEPPAGETALAYYDTEAAIPSDREHAIDGLRNLAKRFPADPRYAITLGRVLTYDPKTRQQGIEILQQYPSIASAQSALEQAKTWNRLAKSAKPVAGSSAYQNNSPVAAAYRDLNSGHLDEARQQFQKLLAKDPKNAAALSGMGYVFMKQRNFASASDYLQRARTAGAKNLDSAITLANFWQRMAKGDAELKNEDSDAAIEDYRAAAKLEPSRPEAMEALGGALLQKGNDAEAADMFNRVLKIAPDRAISWRGLFLAQSGAGDATAALVTSQNMPSGVRAQLDSDPDGLRALAQDDLALGRAAEYNRVVKLALALPFPNQGRGMPPDRQMQYAALLMAIQRYQPAIHLYRQVIAANPENIGAWRALIALQHQLHRDDEALATIGRTPQDVFKRLDDDPGFLATVGSIYQSQHEWTKARQYLERAASNPNAPEPAIELQLADVYAASGEQQKSYAIYRREVEDHPENPAAWRGLIGILHQSGHDRDALHALASIPEPTRLRLESDTGYLQILASVQVATGYNRDALRTFNQIAAVYANGNQPEPLDVRIQYGWALLNSGDKRKLYAVVSTIADSPDMTNQQRADFNRLLSTWSVRRANTASTAGNQRGAIAILETAARAVPGNTGVLNALAGVYLKAGEPKRAVAIYESLNMNGASLAQYEGAIGAALAAGDTKHAATWLQTALNRFQRNPRILQMAGQYEQATGNSHRAVAYYRAALAAMGPESTSEMFLRAGATGTELSSLRNQDSPTRDLVNLLAPNGNTRQKRNATASTSGLWLSDGLSQNAPAQAAPTLGDYAQSGGFVRSAVVDAEDNSSASGDQSNDPLENSGHRVALPNPATVASFGGRKNPPENAYCCSAADSGPINRAPDSSSSTPSRKTAMATLESVLSNDADNMDLPLQLPRNTQMTIAKENSSSEPIDNLPVTQVPTPGPVTPPSPAAQDASQQNPTTGETAIQNPEYLPPFQFNPNQNSSAAPQSPINRPDAQSLPPLTGPEKAARVVQTPRQQISQQLTRLEGASSAWLGGTSSIAYRSGQPGYDRLSIYSTPIEASTTLGTDARLTLIADPVLLDSGEATGAETLRQGTLSASSVPTQQSASGIAGELQLRTPLFAASVGYTPHGFLVGNVTGGLYIHPPSGHFTLTFSRSPILDTQLSYAGLRDEGSVGPTYPGNIWGGVIANGGELQIASGNSDSGWYLQGGGQYISGVHVPTNSRLDGDFGAYWGVWRNPQYGNMTVGMNFFGMHYAQNLRYFTYGQGGYFSPDAYVVAGLPISFTGHYQEKFHYHVNASFGLQAFNEKSSLYFPLDSALQTAEGNLSYPAATNVGGNYNFDGEGSYAIANHWYVGGFMQFNNTRDYASSKVGFYIRYLFRQQPLTENSGPTGIFPASGFRPLQVP